MTPECRGGQLRLGRLGRGPPGRSPGPAQDRRICGADRSRHWRPPPLTRAHTSPLSRPDAGTRCAVANVALQTPGSPSSCESLRPAGTGPRARHTPTLPVPPRRPHVQRPKDGSASRRSPRRAAARRGALDAPGMVPCDDPGRSPGTTQARCPAIPGQGPLRCPGTPRAQPPGSVRPHRREPIALLSGGVDAAAAGGGSPHRALREGRAPRRRASTHAAQSSLSRPRRVAARLGPLKLQGVFFSSFDNLI